MAQVIAFTYAVSDTYEEEKSATFLRDTFSTLWNQHRLTCVLLLLLFLIVVGFCLGLCAWFYRRQRQRFLASRPPEIKLPPPRYPPFPTLQRQRRRPVDEFFPPPVAGGSAATVAAVPAERPLSSLKGKVLGVIQGMKRDQERVGSTLGIELHKFGYFVDDPNSTTVNSEEEDEATRL
jgi:hypothetical protein